MLPPGSADRAATLIRSVRLTEPAALAEWADSVAGNPYGTEWAAYQARLARALPRLPAELAEPVVQFRHRLGSAGVLHLAGLPVPRPLPPTPRLPYAQIRQPVGSEPVLLALGAGLGRIIGFADWHGGDRVQNMYPLRTEANRQNANNSVYLEMHTETAFRPQTPHALVLYCLRADEQATTLFCDLRTAAAELPEPLAALLGMPVFAFATPDGLTEPQPIRRDGTGPDGAGVTVWNYAEALVGTSPAARQALHLLRAAIERNCSAVVLRPGEAVLVDNLHVVHGRSHYQPAYGGSDRWLQRCLVRLPEFEPG